MTWKLLFLQCNGGLHHKWTAWSFLESLPHFLPGFSLPLDSWDPYTQELEPSPRSKMQGLWWRGWTFTATPSKSKDPEGLFALSQWLGAGLGSCRGELWLHGLRLQNMRRSHICFSLNSWASNPLMVPLFTNEETEDKGIHELLESTQLEFNPSEPTRILILTPPDTALKPPPTPPRRSQFYKCPSGTTLDEELLRQQHSNSTLEKTRWLLTSSFFKWTDSNVSDRTTCKNRHWSLKLVSAIYKYWHTCISWCKHAVQKS